MKKIIFINLIVLFSCLSSHSKTIKDEFKIILPPEPDPVLNATTIHGIDVNKNGVRDDIEIYLYKNVTKDWNLFNAYLQYFKNEHEIIINMENREKFKKLTTTEDIKAINCIAYFGSKIDFGTKRMLDLFFDTKARKEYARKISRQMESDTIKLIEKDEKVKGCTFKVKR